MTVTTAIDEPKKIITQTVSGQISREELIDSFESLHGNPDFKPDMNVVWDLREIRIDKYSLDEVQQIPSALASFTAKRGHGYRVALVTDRKTDLQLLQFYQVPLRRMQVDFRVFDDLEDAYRWVDQTQP